MKKEKSDHASQPQLKENLPFTPFPTIGPHTSLEGINICLMNEQMNEEMNKQTEDGGRVQQEEKKDPAQNYPFHSLRHLQAPTAY